MRFPFVPTLAALALGWPGARHGAAQEVWRYGPVPALTLAGTGADGEVQFGVVTAAVRLADGALVVADASAPRLIGFGPDGRRRWIAGRRGAGPGEFTGLWWMGACGDSLYAFDMDQARVSIFGADGTYRRQFLVTPPPGLLRCGRAGSLAFLSGSPTHPTDRGRAAADLRFRHPDGRVTTLRAGVPAAEFALVDGAPVPSPLGRSAVIALTGHGVVLGTADSAALELVSPDGRTSRVFRVPHTPRPPTTKEMDAAIQAVLDRVPVPFQDALRPALARVPAPPALPPYFGLWADRAGNLWVLRTPPGLAPTEFTVLAADGKPVATATCPLALTPHDVGPDFLLGTVATDDGEQHLVLLGRRP